MQISKLSDQELIQLFQEGNEYAFEILLTRHKQKVYTAIYMFVKDRDRADDIFQDVFIKIVNTIRQGKYTHEGKFVQWALRIAYNLCVDQFRRAKRRPVTGGTDDFDIFDVLTSEDGNAERDMMRSQSHEGLKALIDRLPEEQREVIVLRHYADLSFKEIASLTRVSINTALGRMRYALINLRRMIGENEAVYQVS